MCSFKNPTIIKEDNLKRTAREFLKVTSLSNVHTFGKPYTPITGEMRHGWCITCNLRHGGFITGNLRLGGFMTGNLRHGGFITGYLEHSR